MRIPARLTLAFLSLLLAAGSPAVADEPVLVYTVNYPLAYFAQRIGGDSVRVVFPAPPDVDPAFWQPDPDTIRTYQTADIVLLNGADYAKWVSSASLPRRRLVDTSRAVAERIVETGAGVVHSHGPGGESHGHTGTAFTLWLDPTLAMAQTAAIESALTRARPSSATAFESGRVALDADLAALDGSFQRAFASLGDEPLLASHPVYQYLQRRYDLTIDALLWEPDVTPDEDDWRDLDALADAGGARWMLWEDEPTAATRSGLAERGIGVVVVRPLGNRPGDGDYLDGMRANVAAIERAAAGE